MELNEQTLEQILTRQREEFESTLDAKLATQREQLEITIDNRLATQREQLEITIDNRLATQREQLEITIDNRLARLENTFDNKLATQREQLEAVIHEEGERIERRMGVIVESLQTKIEIIGEVVSGIAEELTEVRQLSERNTAAIEQLVITDLVRQTEFQRELAKKADLSALRELERRVSAR